MKQERTQFILLITNLFFIIIFIYTEKKVVYLFCELMNYSLWLLFYMKDWVKEQELPVF